VDRLTDTVVGRVLEIVAEPAPGSPAAEVAPEDGPAGRVSDVLAQLNPDGPVGGQLAGPVEPGPDASPQPVPVIVAGAEDQNASPDPVGAA
jgi:hypothetical protein